MIYVDDTPVVAGFLYNTNSDVAWVDFIISNFNYKDRENRLIAIDMLLKSLEQRDAEKRKLRLLGEEMDIRKEIENTEALKI